VIRYSEPTPLFAKYQVEGYLAGMFNPVVQLKSGGYIVIGVTEALVAIDVNSGRATKEGSIEDTAVKTNLEAADEVARQLRLRDLAGLIVIDFIDMEERKNNLSVEKRLKDKLKTDRARIQVGRISGFGLLEMSRQRLRPGMLESTTQACPHCHGTGLIRSDDSMALQVLRALEEEGTRKRSKEVLLKAPVGIVNYLINQKREHIALIEARYGMSVRIEADPMLVSPDYSMEKLKTATRPVPDTPVVSGHAGLMGAPVAEEEDDDLIDDLVEEEVEEAEAEAPAATAVAVPAAADGDGQPGRKKRRRRRRRRGGAREGEGQVAGGATEGDDDGEEADDEPADAVVEEAPVAAEPVSEAKPKRTRKPRGGRGEPAVTEAPLAAVAAEVVAEVVAEAAPEAVVVVVDEAPAKPAPRKRATKAKAAEPAAEPAVEAPVEAAPKPARARGAKAKATEAPAPVLAPDPGLAPVAETVVQDPEDAAAEVSAKDDASKPKRKGWWSLGR
jgi:ribonuclease E